MTFFFSPPACAGHRTNDGHPESPERLAAVLRSLPSGVQRAETVRATRDDLLLAHDPTHVDAICSLIPDAGFNFVDDDTLVSPGSRDAALDAAGAVLTAVDDVLAGRAANAFCAVRPPGHHAHRAKAGGFCLFNNAAIGALAALKRTGLSRVAIVDFDVHHGDGTQDIAWNEAGIFFASLHQSPLYPFTGVAEERGAHANIVNVPLAGGSGGVAARTAMADIVMPRLDAFAPELVIVSAGFDAHEKDPLGALGWTTQDYAALMDMILDIADRHCGGKLVAVLEGGYNTAALAESVVACLERMMNRSQP